MEARFDRDPIADPHRNPGRIHRPRATKRGAVARSGSPGRRIIRSCRAARRARRSDAQKLKETEALEITIYHNPDCGTSRNALFAIRAAGHKPRIFEYLKTPLSRGAIAELARH